MKKLIAILTIMMVVFGVAFAATETTTGNEELKVTCLVKAAEPKFTFMVEHQIQHLPRH